MPDYQEPAGRPIAGPQLEGIVGETLAATPIVDIHTHLFAPAFGAAALWGIDALLTYHYLEAELFRFAPIRPDQYWALEPAERADLVWKTLFVENPPISEATRGVVAVLQAFGLDPSAPTLAPLRAFFGRQRLEEHISRVFELAGISAAVMTNDPLDAAEQAVWKRGFEGDPRFVAALRLDRIVSEWNQHWRALGEQGYAVEEGGGGRTLAEVRRFLADWAARMDPVYLALSLPETFQYPADDFRTRLFEGAILPACRELDVPLALMMGVRRQVNPALRLAGDAAGRSDLKALEALCRTYPEQRFLVTVLSRENQHELAVYARKFRNLMPFGCWWFLNNPSMVEEITRERLEMLGTSFIPQHSDARILEQVVYKWRNTRRTIAPLLADAYRLLLEDGGTVSRAMIERDVRRLFRENFESWTKPRAACSESLI